MTSNLTLLRLRVLWRLDINAIFSIVKLLPLILLLSPLMLTTTMIGSNDINPDQSSPLVLAFSSTMNFVNYQKTRSSRQSSMNRSWTGEIVAQGRTTEGSSFAVPSTVRSHETEPRILVTKTSTSTNLNTITRSKNGKNENNIENTATPTTTTNSRKNKSNVPRHVGLICDGNGRWASQRSLPRALGHLEGARRIVDLIQSLTEERKQKRQEKQEESNDSSSSSLVDCITLYWFSTENWNRSPAEINKIFEAAEFYINAFLNNTVVLEEARIRVLGDLDDPRLPKSMWTAMRKLEEKTSGGNDHKGKNDNDSDSDNNNDSNNNESDTHQSPRTPPFRRLDVCFAINYGGRQDIVSACQHIGQQVRDGIIVDPSSITEDLFSRSMSTSSSLQLECPDPDLIIRTGGEHRLSNFMTWNSAYSEIHVTDMLWPDFLKHTGWKRSLEWYKHRKRNYGGREQDDDEHEKEIGNNEN